MLSQAQNQQSNGWLLLLIVAAIAIAVLLALPALGELELTQHAAQGRESTSLDAATISGMIQNKTCRPVEIYECPAHYQKKVICKLTGKGDIWGGLIIGTATDPPVIVTGYPAPYKYWMGTVLRDGCILATYVP